MSGPFNPLTVQSDVDVTFDPSDTLPVFVPGNEVNTYGSISSVATGTPTAVVTYTVPVGQTFYLRHAAFSGDTVATFWLEIGGVTQTLKRTYFTEYNGDFFFESDMSNGLSIAAGVVVRVMVEHSRPSTGDFNANINGRLI